VEGILLPVAAGRRRWRQINAHHLAGIRWSASIGYRTGCPSIPYRLRTSRRPSSASDHLIEMGHQRIAIVTGPLTLKNERQRLLGYYQSLERAGMRADTDLIWEGNNLADDVAALCRIDCAT